MGTFDDLIPQQNKADQSASAPAGGGTGTFGDLIPSASDNHAVPAASGPGVLGSIWQGLKHGATAGWSDQIEGVLAAEGMAEAYPYLGPENQADVEKAGGIYGVGKQAEREAAARGEAARSSHQVAYGLGEIAGGVAPMLLAPEVGAATLPAKMWQGAKLGALYGGASGASEGEKEGGLPGMAAGAVEGAGEGLIGGAGGTLLGAGAAKAGRFLYDHSVGPLVSTARGLINPGAEASRRVAGTLVNDAPNVASGRDIGLTPSEWIDAKNAGEPVILADLGGEPTRALMRSAANSSAEGRAALNDVLQQRYQEQSDRGGATIRSLVSGGADTAKTKAQLEAEYDAERGTAYGAAYDAGDRPVWSPELERLTGAPSVAQAVRGAIGTWKDWQVRDGFGAMNPPFKVTPDGQLQSTGGQGMLPYPNLQLWDYAQRILSDRARAAARAGSDQEAARVGGLATQLKSELDKQVPEFGTARGIAANYFGGNDAVEAGEKAVGFKGDIRDLQRTMAQMRPAERAMFQEAYADAMARKVENMPDTTDVAKRVYNSPQERARVNAVLGPEAADRLGAWVDREKVYNVVRNSLGNSSTARQMIEAGLAGGVGGALLGQGDPSSILTGATVGALGGGAGAKAGMTHGIVSAGVKTALGYVDRNTAARVAKLLASNDPTELMEGLRQASKNKRVADALRNVGSRAAAFSGIKGSGGLPLQLPASVGAQQNDQGVPGPVQQQKRGGAVNQQKAMAHGGSVRDSRQSRIRSPADIPGARLARDGYHYVADPNRSGKYLRIVPRAAAAG